MFSSTSFLQALQTVKKSTTPARVTITKIPQPKPFVSQYALTVITFKNNQAYLPSQAEDPRKLVWVTAPVFQCNISIDDLTSLVTRALHTPYQRITLAEADRLNQARTIRTNPILKATHSSSWRKLVKTSISYSIQATKKDSIWLLSLYSPKRGKSRSLEFPIDTPLRKLVKIIIADARKYPHVFKVGDA